MAHKSTAGKDAATAHRGGLASVCSYDSASPDSQGPKDALESVSNDSLASYSPPALSPVSVEPYPPSSKPTPEAKGSRGEAEAKKQGKRRKSRDKEHRRRRRSKSPGEGGHRKKKRRHEPGSPRRTKKSSSKKQKKRHHRSSVSSRESKVVPRSYRSPSPDKAHHHRSPSSDCRRGLQAYDDISSPGSPYSYPRRTPPNSHYNRRYIHRSPPPGRHGYSPPHRRRSPPSPYYGRSPSSPGFLRYNSISPSHRRYRGSPSPRRRPSPPRRRKGRGYSPPRSRVSRPRTNSPDDRGRWHGRSPPPDSRSAGSEGRKEEEREKARKKAKLSTKSGSISWERSDEGGSKKVATEATDSGKPLSPPPPPPPLPPPPAPQTEADTKRELQATSSAAEEKVETVPPALEPEPAGNVAPPLPSDAPPPPPPPEEDEKPPLPPVPSLPVFVPPPTVTQPDDKATDSSSTPLDQAIDKNLLVSSPRKPSSSPISLGSSPALSRPLSTQTTAIATPELPPEPLQPREHKPRCIDAFEIIDQIGEGTYGKVTLSRFGC